MAELSHSAYSKQVRWLLFSLIVLSVVLSWSGIIDHYTTAYIDDALVRVSRDSGNFSYNDD
ncbi:hypothetical protein [Arsukibacterium ikkense]|uniref:hypothetical protein n=1 Tax=Arsukibacterium ikkense TaxID=336831 RepID=UPI00128D3D1E|nr:hypothetical protein [Arsukibacterium ikkense]